MSPRSARALMRRALAALGWAGALALHAPGAAAAEAIERFLATIEVRADGDLLVRESITVRAEGRQIRRGIYRDFPLRFVDAQGREQSVDFELLEVTRDGRDEPHFTRASPGGVRIYAGDEHRALAPGVYRYEFRYRTGRQLRRLAEGDELVWNVTGNEWRFPIHSARARVILPGAAKPLRWSAYTGRLGERGEDFTAQWQADGVLQFDTTRTLAPGEGFTVVTQLPPGLVAAPGGWQQLRHAWLDYRRYLVAAIGLVVVAAYYLFAWRAVGRDPPRGTVIPLFHPPASISPALAAYVRQWGWGDGWREFTAAALSLAVKGLLRFEDPGAGLTLKRVGTAPAAASLPPGERALLGWVDSRGGSVAIEPANGPAIAAALKSFKDAIERENRHRFFRRNLGWWLAGLALTALAIGTLIGFGGLGADESGFLVQAVVALVAIGALGSRLFALTARSLFSGRSVRQIAGVAIHLAVLTFVATTLLVEQIGPILAEPGAFARSLPAVLAGQGFALVLVVALATLNGLFHYLLRAPTAAGSVVMDQLEGLALYLRTAETPAMNQAGAPELTTEHFERLLPYAVALGLEEPWSAAFEAAFSRSHPGVSASDAYQPAWRSGRSWSEGSLARSIAATMGSTLGSFASAVPPPRTTSSGFGGGGGSGGGGGGGGGGGW